MLIKEPTMYIIQFIISIIRILWLINHGLGKIGQDVACFRWKVLKNYWRIGCIIVVLNKFKHWINFATIINCY